MIMTDRPGRSWLARVVFWAPLVVPSLWVAFVLGIQPAEHLGLPRGDDIVNGSGVLLYDDYDHAAMVLRGLNANRGRLAGPVGEPGEALDSTIRFREGLREFKAGEPESTPLAACYHLEYPHTALLLFRVAAWVGNLPTALPAVVLDASYHDIVNQDPQDESDRRLAAGFRRGIRFLIVVMTAALLALVLTLRAGYEPGGGLASTGLMLLLPAALYFSLFRFDILPTLLTALSLVCLGRRRWTTAGIFLGLAALFKVYPVLLVPLFVRYLVDAEARDGRGIRSALLWLAGFGGIVALCVLPSILSSGWESFWTPYQFQLNRKPFQWTVYGFYPPETLTPDTTFRYHLPESLAANTAVGKVFRLGMLLVAGLGLAIWPVRDLTSLLRRGAVVLIVFIGLSVVFSPQWILWLAPFLLPLAARSRLLTVLVIALDLATFLLWPYILRSPDEFLRVTGDDLLPPTVNYLRFALFGALIVVLLVAEVLPRR